MSAWPARRLAAAGTVVFVALLLIANFSPGEAPKFDASQAKIAAFFHDHHRTIVIAMILSGIAVAVFLYVIAQLASMLNDAGQRGAAAVVVVGGIATAAVGTISDGLFLAAAQVGATGGDPGTVRTIYQVSGISYERFFWPAILIALALAFAGWRGAIARWMLWLGGAAAVLLVLGGISIRTHGAFSPGGALSIIGFVAFLVTILGSGLVLWQAEEPVEAPATAAVSA